MHIWVRDHRFVDLIQIHNNLGEIFRVGVWHQRRFFARPDLRDTGVCAINQTLQHVCIVIHALVDHDLDA